MNIATAIPGPDPGPHLSADGPIRLMVVDDSVTARTVFSRIIACEDDLELMSEAATAEEALKILAVAEVDVILLDLEMPGRGGLDALPEMIATAPEARILVVSSLTMEGAEATLAALSLGAAGTLAKPRPGLFNQDYRDQLVSKIRALGGTALRVAMPSAAKEQKTPSLRPASRERARVLAIGASTGGIHALGALFNALPPRLEIPILVTQHLPVSFMDAFARQLHSASGREVSLAADGLVLQADHINIAPGNAHMTIVENAGQLEIKLDNRPAPSGCMPSVDPMFESLAEVLGPHALGVVLSGMGRDGTEGAGRIVSSGGTILAQDEASCAVWGMPGSVAMAGLASSILGPVQLAERIAACAKVA